MTKDLGMMTKEFEMYPKTMATEDLLTRESNDKICILKLLL